jgi:hypothetical protein
MLCEELINCFELHIDRFDGAVTMDREKNIFIRKDAQNIVDAFLAGGIAESTDCFFWAITVF